jgi:hypothetical protein
MDRRLTPGGSDSETADRLAEQARRSRSPYRTHPEGGASRRWMTRLRWERRRENASSEWEVICCGNVHVCGSKGARELETVDGDFILGIPSYSLSWLELVQNAKDQFWKSILTYPLPNRFDPCGEEVPAFPGKALRTAALGQPNRIGGLDD